MISRFKKNVEKYPNRVAYKNRNESITYKELLTKAEMVSSFLIEQGKDPVIIYGKKQAYMIIGMLACLLTHRTYVPVDSTQPKERIKNIISISKASLIISDEELDLGIKCININEISISTDIKPIYENDIAYIMFTSGSTGNPKAVPICSSNLDNFVSWISNIYPLNEYKHINVFNQANFNFDLSVTDIYYSLFNGHTLIAYEKDDNFNYLYDLLNKEHIDLLVITPTFLELFLLDKDFNVGNYKSIKCIYCCGERLDIATSKKLFSRFPNIKLINAYGPTEATSAVTCFVINRENVNDFDELPIGDISNSACDIDIVKEEIIIKGKSVFFGYLNGDNSCLYKDGNVNCYRTGDLGFIKDGKLFFKGRKDRQIKYKGYRIELDEIEIAFKNIAEIDEACVICKYDNNNKVKLLKAFYTSKEILSRDYIISSLKNKLPNYMIPSIIERIDKIPINRNGKIDREAFYDKY